MTLTQEAVLDRELSNDIPDSFFPTEAFDVDEEIERELERKELEELLSIERSIDEDVKEAEKTKPDLNPVDFALGFKAAIIRIEKMAKEFGL